MLLFIVGMDKIGKCVFFPFYSYFYLQRPNCSSPQLSLKPISSPPPHYSLKNGYYWRSMYVQPVYHPTTNCYWVDVKIVDGHNVPSAIIIFSMIFSQDLGPNRSTFSIVSVFRAANICFIYIFTSFPMCRPICLLGISSNWILKKIHFH